jgi:hypothetical protein
MKIFGTMKVVAVEVDHIQEKKGKRKKERTKKKNQSTKKIEGKTAIPQVIPPRAG